MNKRGNTKAIIVIIGILILLVIIGFLLFKFGVIDLTQFSTIPSELTSSSSNAGSGGGLG